MSIGNALTNALTGLSANSRAAEIVSSNVANALTEGYGRREVELATQVLGRDGAGVRVAGITRATDPVMLGERRMADAEVALASVRSGYLERLERVLGQPDLGDSIAGRVAAFESALIESASRPESEARLQTVLSTAGALAGTVNDAARGLMALRTEADHEIGKTVETLQAALQSVVDLNVAIQKATNNGYDPNSLIDQRQQMIDRIAEIVPVKEVPRAHNMVALYTPGGAILVDHKAAELGFAPVNTITPDMTVAGGALSGLTINGQPVSTDADRGPIAGGKLSALFEFRDTVAPTAQAQLDAVARDLVERFADPAVDGTLAPGDPGLFTDGGAAFNVADEEALSLRLSVNAAADPAQGGALWRLRDGMNAATSGPPGDATRLQSMADALAAPRIPASGGLSALSRSAHGPAADVFSLTATARQRIDTDLSFAAARQDTLKGLELENGVDTDQELQNLLLIEKAYAANARVISAVDELINQLLGL